MNKSVLEASGFFASDSMVFLVCSGFAYTNITTGENCLSVMVIGLRVVDDQSRKSIIKSMNDRLPM